MRFAALISWLVTASLGAFMLRTWLVRGGLGRERAKAGGLPPQLIFGHATVAIVGLLGWIAFLASDARPLAWAAVALLMAAVGLGLCTVTLWTPYPARKPGERRPASRWDTPVRNAAVPDTTGPDTTGPDTTGPDTTGPDATGPDATGAAQVPGTPPAAAGPGSAQPMFEVTDEMIARFLADPGPAPRPRPIRPNLAVLVPVAHGFAAIATFMLALVSAIT